MKFRIRKHEHSVRHSIEGPLALTRIFYTVEMAHKFWCFTFWRTLRTNTWERTVLEFPAAGAARRTARMEVASKRILALSKARRPGVPKKDSWIIEEN
jgi:hypothetical protein